MDTRFNGDPVASPAPKFEPAYKIEWDLIKDPDSMLSEELSASSVGYPISQYPSMIVSDPISTP